MLESSRLKANFPAERRSAVSLDCRVAPREYFSRPSSQIADPKERSHLVSLGAYIHLHVTVHERSKKV